MRELNRGILWIGMLCMISPPLASQAEAFVSLTPAVSVSEQYNDNLFFSQTNKVNDISTIISPRLTIQYDSKDLLLGGTYFGFAEMFSRNQEANGYFQTFTTDIQPKFLTKRVEGLEITVIERLNFTPSLPAFQFQGPPDQNQSLNGGSPNSPAVTPGVPIGPGGIPPGGALSSALSQGIAFHRTNTTSNVAGLTANYAVTPRTTATASYTNQIIKFEDPSFRDSTNNTFGLGWQYLVSPRATVNASITQTLSQTDNSPNSTFRSYRIGSTYQFSPQLAASSNVGATTSDTGPTSFVTSNNITHHTDTIFSSLQITQNVVPAGGVTTTSTTNLSFTGSTTWRFSQIASAFLFVAYGQTKSQGGSNEIDVTNYSVSPGISVTIRQWLSANLTYSHFNQNSSGTTNVSGERNLVIFTLTASGLPWKFID